MVAVEPDPQMLAVLAGRLPQVRALPGSAERIPLPDGSVDAILAGQAFHWFSRPDADREFARVLRPGGVVGLLWNIPDRSVDWVRQLYQATRKPELAGSEFDPLDERAVRPRRAGRGALRPPAGRPGRAARPGAQLELGDHPVARPSRTPSTTGCASSSPSHPELQGPVVVMPQRTDVVWQLRR